MVLLPGRLARRGILHFQQLGQLGAFPCAGNRRGAQHWINLMSDLLYPSVLTVKSVS